MSCTSSPKSLLYHVSLFVVALAAVHVGLTRFFNVNLLDTHFANLRGPAEIVVGVAGFVVLVTLVMCLFNGGCCKVNE